MGLELNEKQQKVQDAQIRTFKAWDAVRVVETQYFNPRRKEIYQEYLNAIREESEIKEQYARETGLIPAFHLPFEFYYLYYEPGTYKRKKWEKICHAYKNRKDKK